MNSLGVSQKILDLGGDFLFGVVVLGRTTFQSLAMVRPFS